VFSHRKMPVFFIALFFLFSSTVLIAQKVTITLWKDSAIGAIYNKATKSVAYGRPDKKQCYKIYVCDSSGKNDKQLTWHQWSNERQQWPEEWTPDGQYLFCYVEKTEYIKEKKHKRKRVDATPGYGAYCDLWLIKRDGSKAWKILDLPNNYNSGIIHSAISEDGKLFAWSERYKAPSIGDLAGCYYLKVADFTMDSVPHFENIRTFKPGNTDATNELDGISKDNKLISFYSTFEGKNLFSTPIYTLNIETNEIKKLTDESFAQAATFSPDGTKLVYMTGADCDIFPFEIQGADWWIMNINGTEKKRLTYMNKKDHEHSVNHYRLAGCLSFIDDQTFLGGVMVKPLGLIGHTVVVRWEE
jgi:Tol biopolymer transport system component